MQTLGMGGFGQNPQNMMMFPPGLPHPSMMHMMQQNGGFGQSKDKN
jgi:hypothetical protein